MSCESYEGPAFWDIPPALKNLTKKHPPIGNYSDPTPKHLDLLSPIEESMRKEGFKEELHIILTIIKTALSVGHPNLSEVTQHFKNLVKEGDKYSTKGKFYYSACRDALAPIFEDVCMLSGLGYPPKYYPYVEMIDLKQEMEDQKLNHSVGDTMYFMASRLFRMIKEYNDLPLIEGKDKVDLIAMYRHLYLSPKNLSQHCSKQYLDETHKAYNNVVCHIYNYK